MKLTMFEVVQIAPVFAKLTGKGLPLRTAYNLNKIAEVVDKESVFYYDTLKKVFEKYGDSDADGQPIFTDIEKRMRKIKDDSREEAMRELNELTSLEIEFSDKLQIPLTSLEKVEISIDDLHPLVPFITD